MGDLLSCAPRRPTTRQTDTTMSDVEHTETPKDRKFVEALSRGLDVLRAFTHGSVVMGNQDIARITGSVSYTHLTLPTIYSV